MAVKKISKSGTKVTEYDSELDYQFGENFRKFRQQKSMTQEDMAKVLGVGQSMISKYEKGENYPDGKGLKKLKDKLGANIAALFGGVESNMSALLTLRSKFDDLKSLHLQEEELFRKFKEDKASIYRQIAEIINGKFEP